MNEIFVMNSLDKFQREYYIKEALSQGKIVRFKLGDIEKDINEWKLNEEGDLIAFRSTGISNVIAWDASFRYDIQYEIIILENYESSTNSNS